MRGILLYPVKRNGANPSQSQIAGSTTSRFDQCNAVKSSRLPRSRRICAVRGNTSSPPGIIFSVYDSEDDIPEIPVHPNCRCTITEDVIDPDGNTISSKPFSPKKTTAAPEKAANTSAGKATFEKPVNTKSGYYAVFDGKKFTLYADNKPVISWDATSGRSGFQSPQYQNRKSMGPIPEEVYVARQEELQHITPVGFMAGLIPGKYGEWPGSLYSWGNSRVWLEPSNTTNTYGRDGFTIHGGLFPGSAGCIDLTGQINMFIPWLESTGKDLIIYVEY